MSRGYYINSLQAWRSDLAKREKSLAARLRRLQKTGHPIADDQLLLLDVNARMKRVVEEALTVAVIAERSERRHSVLADHGTE